MNGKKKKLIDRWYSEFISFTGANFNDSQKNKVINRIKKEKAEFIRNDIEFMRKEKIRVHNLRAQEVKRQKEQQVEANGEED